MSIPTWGQMKQDPVFSGKRVKRGLYKSKSGKKINADVNGSYNILRKVAPDALRKGVEDCVVNPIPLQVQTSKSRICYILGTIRVPSLQVCRGRPPGTTVGNVGSVSVGFHHAYRTRRSHHAAYFRVSRPSQSTHFPFGFR